MVRLIDPNTGNEIALISEDQLAFLQDALEEEGPEDRDYWIDADTVEMLAARPAAPPDLIAVLRRAVEQVRETRAGLRVADLHERMVLRSTRTGKLYVCRTLSGEKATGPADPVEATMRPDGPWTDRPDLD